MDVLKVQDLRKDFGGLRAVNELNFSVEENSITALIGPNGAGKTTVFNLITGFSYPNNGSAYFYDSRVTGRKPNVIANMGMVRTFQLIRIYKRLNVLDNVLLGCRDSLGESVFGAITKSKRVRQIEQEKREKAMELLSMMGLEKYADTYAQNLGYGQQKTIEIARALATDAKMILLDEPMAGLSGDMISVMIDLIRKLKEQGKTIFFIEHNMKVVMDISEQVIVINFGKKIAEGPPDEIKHNDRVIEAYLGSDWKKHATDVEMGIEDEEDNQ